MAKLTDPLVALVHHVELNQHGWWDRAMERLVLATLTEVGEVRKEELPHRIESQFHVAVDPQQVARIVDRLFGSVSIVKGSGGGVEIAETKRAELAAAQAHGERLEAATRDRLLQELAAVGLELEDAEVFWERFSEGWLIPAVAALGARTYEVVTGKFEDWLDLANLRAFLEHVPAEQRGALREAIERFLDPKDPAVREYLLRLMDAYFVVEASRLSDETLGALEEMTRQRPSFNLLLDTNVILSILGLHGEAKGEAANLLIQLARELGNRASVQVGVLPETIEETVAVLRGEVGRLSGIRLTSNAARAAHAATSSDEVMAAYLEAASHSGRGLTAESWLGPYIRDLRVVLKGKGIEVFNVSTEAVYVRADIVQQVDSQFAFEQRKYGAKGKSRDRIAHDIVLWFVTHERRPRGSESPSEACYWLVTEDTRLLGFDFRKRAGTGLPVAIQPLALAQLLQFWTGRTEGIEQALIGGMRLSLFSNEDGPDSATTLKILQTLSRFENLNDLPPDAVAHLLINDALRVRLTGAQSEEEAQEFVREEILEEYRRVLHERDAERQRAEELAARYEQEAATRRAAEELAREEKGRALTVEQRLAKTRTILSETVDRLGQVEATNAARANREAILTDALSDANRKLDELADRSAERDRRDAVRTKRSRFFWSWMVPGVVMLFALAASSRAAKVAAFLGATWRWSLPVFGMTVAGWLTLLAWRVRRDDDLRRWWVGWIVVMLHLLFAVAVIDILKEVAGSYAADLWKAAPAASESARIDLNRPVASPPRNPGPDPDTDAKTPSPGAP